jgi:hypothetical protein
MHTVQRILREMRISQQASGLPFDYLEFKSRVLESGLTPGQLEPLKQRLDILESFMPETQTINHKKKTDWSPEKEDRSSERYHLET